MYRFIRFFSIIIKVSKAKYIPTFSNMRCGREPFVTWLCALGACPPWRDAFRRGGSRGAAFSAVDWRLVSLRAFLGKVCDVYWELCLGWFPLGWGRVPMDGGGGGSGSCLPLGGGGGKSSCRGKLWTDGGTGGRGSFLLRGGGGGSSSSDGRRCLGDEIWDCARVGACAEALRGRVLEGGRPSLLGNGGGAPLISRAAIVQSMTLQK